MRHAAIAPEAAGYTILGARGFIGQRLRAMLLAKDASCYAPDRGDEAIFARHLGTVFYCIGLTGDYATRPFDTVEAHVSALARVIEKASFDRLIYLSSTRLYDSLGEGPATEAADLPLNPANPRHIYDLSKALGESLCLTASSGRARVARLSNVYDTALDATGVLPELLRRLRRERRLVLDAASGVVRDYIHVGDVVRGLLAFAEDTRGGIMNLASGQNVSNGEIIACLNARGFEITLTRETARDIHPVCDISRLNGLGIQPMSLRSFLAALPVPT